jgi:shikimate kinase
MKNIYLVGFMGTGKSAVGKELAGQRKMRFADLDQLIEAREKREIAEIFAKDGEAYFRRMEKQTLAEISQKQDYVVSCGGGIVLDPDNIRMMKTSGIVICLQASPETILKRTRKFRHRPLLNVANPEEKIISLLNERAPYYAQADITLDTSEIPVKEVVRQALEYIDKKNG